MSEQTEEAIKIGAMMSAKNKAKAQAMHDYSTELGAVCAAKKAHKAIKSVTDAPNLRGNDSRACENCNFYKSLPATEISVYGNMGEAEGYARQGICTKFDFMTQPDYVCDTWAEFKYDEMVSPVKATGLDMDVTFDTPPLAIKIAGEMELDVCYMPYSGQRNGKDSDGQYFSPRTKEHADKFPTPLVLYYHGYEARGVQQPIPVEIGSPTGKKWQDKAGRWMRVKLDGAIEKAVTVWQSAQKGNARASSDSIAHLVRTNPDGEITNWPFVGISLFETETGKKPANSFAFAKPAAKALGLDVEEEDNGEDIKAIAAIVSAIIK